MVTPIQAPRVNWPTQPIAQEETPNLAEMYMKGVAQRQEQEYKAKQMELQQGQLDLQQQTMQMNQEKNRRDLAKEEEVQRVIGHLIANREQIMSDPQALRTWEMMAASTGDPRAIGVVEAMEQNQVDMGVLDQAMQRLEDAYHQGPEIYNQTVESLKQQPGYEQWPYPTYETMGNGLKNKQAFDTDPEGFTKVGGAYANVPGNPTPQTFWTQGDQAFVMGEDGKMVRTPGGTTFGEGNLTGTPDELGLVTKKAQGEVEARLLNSFEQLARVNEIDAMYDPKFLQVPFRAQAAWSGLKSKFGSEPPPKIRAQLIEYNTYRATALDALNRYIKDITGAAMSLPEAERITATFPNPGKGIMDGDSPAAFEGKMNAIKRSLRLVAARYHYVKKNGLDAGNADYFGAGDGNLSQAERDMPLNAFKEIIDKRGRELARELQMEGGLNDTQIRQRVRDQLAFEFGLSGV